MTSLIRSPFIAGDTMISARPDTGWACAMTQLERLYTEQRQSPWLDNLTRAYLRDGTLAAFVADGIRGRDSQSDDLGEGHRRPPMPMTRSFALLTAAGCSVEDAYWELAVHDVTDALAVLRPTYDNSRGSDGFVSIEVAPELARDTAATIAAAARLHERIARPNLLVKIPATAEGIPAIAALIGRGLSINVTLIFSLSRYEQVIEAYLHGLETLAERGGDLAAVRSVASFFVSRVDTEVDHRLEQIGGDGRAGAARTCRQSPRHVWPTRCSGTDSPARDGRNSPPAAPTCNRRCGHRRRRRTPTTPTPSTSTASSAPTRSTRWPRPPSPHSRTTAPSRAPSTRRSSRPTRVMHDLRAVGVDMDDVGHTLEDQGVAGFHQSFADLLITLRRQGTPAGAAMIALAATPRRTASGIDALSGLVDKLSVLRRGR